MRYEWLRSVFLLYLLFRGISYINEIVFKKKKYEKNQKEKYLENISPLLNEQNKYLLKGDGERREKRIS